MNSRDGLCEISVIMEDDRYAALLFVGYILRKVVNYVKFVLLLE